jgi:transposase
MEEFEHLLWHSGLTTDARNYAISQLGSQTFTDIATGLGVCVQTIANIANEFSESEREQRLKTPYRYLSMDEVFISRDADGNARYYWVLNDISTPWKSNNIRVDLGRNKDDVVKRLKELAHSQRVEAVCIDMWKPYRDAIHEAFPSAAVVVDPFHVIQLAQKKMDEVRKSIKCDKALKSAIKDDAYLFSTSLYKLSNDELDRLETYLQVNLALESAYFIVQELMALYRLRDYESVLDYLAHWESSVLKSGLDEMVSILHTVQNWLPYIMNHFIYRISNGKTEGKNHKLRVIDAMGYHYGANAVQACLYAHDTKQEYLKWQNHLRRRTRLSVSAAA